LLAAFSHTAATYGRILFQCAQPYGFALLDPFRAAVTGSDTKAHRPQRCRPFRVNPDCHWQRSAGAAPCRTPLTISEEGANCNRNLRLLNRFFASLFPPTPFHTGNESFQLNCRSMKRFAISLHYEDREPKEAHRVSCRASPLVSVIFCFSFLGGVFAALYAGREDFFILASPVAQPHHSEYLPHPLLPSVCQTHIHASRRAAMR